MNTYFSPTLKKVRELTNAQLTELNAAGGDWTPVPAPPAYAPATQNPPQFSLDAGTWVTSAKTAEELAAFAEQQEQEAERAQIRSVIGDLKAGTGTAAQRMTRLERVCVFLLRNAFILLLTAGFAMAGITVVTTVDAPLATDPPVVGYVMYRRTGTLAAPIWTKVKTFPTNDRRFDITELGPGNYAVAAYNAGGESDKSNEVVIPGVPGKPIGLKVTIEFTP